MFEVVLGIMFLDDLEAMKNTTDKIKIVIDRTLILK